VRWHEASSWDADQSWPSISVEKRLAAVTLARCRRILLVAITSAIRRSASCASGGRRAAFKSGEPKFKVEIVGMVHLRGDQKIWKKYWSLSAKRQ
jgi:hypothetical protein